jgi:hypothetical protein
MSASEGDSFGSLGEQAINSDAFELDLKINAGYQAYSAELLRLSLLAISGLAIVWLRIYLPERPHAAPSRSFGVLMALSFALLTISAAAALIHRYTAADSLAFHLTMLRRYKRRRPGSTDHPSDLELAHRQQKERNRLFWLSGRLLRCSAGALMLGVAIFGLAMWSLT